MLSLLLLGFLIGMRHALEADHIAAVATLVRTTNNLNQAIKLGSIWGIGHTITLFIVASLVLLTDAFIPQLMASWLELIVGLMLIVLGVDVLLRLIKDKIHFHTHQHSQQAPHFHAHSHKNQSSQEQANHDHQHLVGGLPFRALFVGIVHGLAGSAALILLTLETIKSPLEGLIYISLFGIGSILGMAILSYIISIPLRASAKRLTWMHNSLQFLIGIATVILGSNILIENFSVFYS